MAKPIAPTPALDEEDSRAVIASLDRRVPEAVMAKRRAAAEAFLTRLTTPRSSDDPSQTNLFVDGTRDARRR